MASRMLLLIRCAYLVGLALLIIALLSFILRTRFLDVPPLVFEGFGFTVVAFALGYSKKKVLLGFLLVSVIIAAIVDPLVWNAHGVNIKQAGLFSVAVNGIMGLISVIFYCAGRAIRRKIAP